MTDTTETTFLDAIRNLMGCDCCSDSDEIRMFIGLPSIGELEEAADEADWEGPADDAYEEALCADRPGLLVAALRSPNGRKALEEILND